METHLNPQNLGGEPCATNQKGEPLTNASPLVASKGADPDVPSAGSSAEVCLTGSVKLTTDCTGPFHSMPDPIPSLASRMNTPSDTPLTDAAEQKHVRWQRRSYEAGMRGSHLDSDDPEPPSGWAVAADLERRLALTERERDEARLDSERLEWAMDHVSGAGWAAAGVFYSAGCTRTEIDSAMALQPQAATQGEA